jgi:DNA polymerase elongation subunit (family B)
MMQYNISPETVVDRRTANVNVDNCLEHRRPDSILPDHSIAANGIHFRKDIRGVIPSIIDGLYSERKVIKQEMLRVTQLTEEGKTDGKELSSLDASQMAIKIMMNALFGSFANKWFRYYDPRIAEAITLSGQLSIRWAEKAVNDYMNKVLSTEGTDYVIAIDTDSVYMNFGPLVEKMGMTERDKITKGIDQIVEEKFIPLIEDSYNELAYYMDAYENKMVMGREVIADAGIWTAKKRYILNVLNSEGVQYAKPKLKIMGIEAVKSSTPASCRDALKGLFNILIVGTEDKTQQAIAMFKTHFNTLPPHDIAFPRGVSDIGKWKHPDTIYMKGTPIHVRGALLYNALLKELDLERKYTPIKDGEKIKFLYLNPKNPIKENVIAFPDYLPEEFDLHKYVDHKLMFEKAFMNPVNPILTAINWQPEPTISLEDFFA